MKNLMMIGFMAIISSVAFGQKRVKSDPTYSIHNYKHPNKVAYARKHNLDLAIKLETISVVQNENYKQLFGKRTVAKKYSLGVQPANAKSGSYKHPHGL